LYFITNHCHKKESEGKIFLQKAGLDIEKINNNDIIKEPAEDR